MLTSLSNMLFTFRIHFGSKASSIATRRIACFRAFLAVPPMPTLRVASDFSGFGSFHAAAAILSHGDVQHVFATDDSRPCQQWLRDVLKVDYVTGFEGRKCNATGAFDARGESLTSTQSGTLDIYGCTFPAVPGGGRSTGDEKDRAAKGFFSIIRTIVHLKPRLAILINGPGRGPPNRDPTPIEAAMNVLGSHYKVMHLRVNDSKVRGVIDESVPFVICARRDALSEKYAKAAESTLGTFIHKLLPKNNTTNWVTVLANGPAPIHDTTSVQSLPSSGCCCIWSKLCPEHVCTCAKCADGPSVKHCIWRKPHKAFSKSVSFKRLRTRFLSKWRHAKKDPKLKQVPSYTELAHMKRMPLQSLQDCKDRSLVNLLSQAHNLFNPTLAIALNATPSKTIVAKSRACPPLRGGRVFVPSAGKFLNLAQLYILNGFSVKAEVFEKVQEINEEHASTFMASTYSVNTITAILKVCMNMFK